MKVIIIGAGRVGTVIGYLLQENGFEILGVNNKHLNSASEAVKLIGDGECFTRKELEKNIKLADLIIVTTPDDVIADIADFLTRCNLKKPVYLMHMSGLYPSHILNKNCIKGCHVFSLHPLQAVASFNEGVKLLPVATFSLEGDEKGLEFGIKLSDRLNLNYCLIKSENKSLYHAAAVIASNYLVTLVNSSYEVLAKAGIQDKDIRNGILNLISGTLSNLENMEPAEVLTGPVARNDINTIKEHRKKLEEIVPEQLKLYNILGEYTAKMANKQQLLQIFKNE